MSIAVLLNDIVDEVIIGLETYFKMLANGYVETVQPLSLENKGC